MEESGEKRWDDYLRNETVCSTTVLSGFGLTLPVISGRIDADGISAFDGQGHIQSEDEQHQSLDLHDQVPSVLITEAYRKSQAFSDMEAPRVIGQKPNSSGNRRLRPSQMMPEKRHSASTDFRRDLRSGSESRLHNISTSDSGPNSRDGRLKRNKSTPSLSTLAKKEAASVSTSSSTPRQSSGRLKISGTLRTASAHVRFLRKLRKAEKARLQRQNRKKSTEVVEKPLEKLRRILRSIRIIVEVCLALKSYVKKKEEDEKLTLVEMQLNLQADLNKKLSFNPHYYSASYIANKGSSKLKKLLAIAPEARSKRHVKMIHALVQSKNAFSKHPVSIRLKMCQVMIYQSYESRRVIIKQGHPPSAFYIILSGTCMINEKETDKKGEDVVQTINEIKEGEVFGEVALLNKTTRTASVVCKDDVELLVIYKEDFDAIVRRPIYKQREEVIEFCKDLNILQDWPVEVLVDASFANFQYQYYRKACVVVKNNFLSNFIVFIKSGECQVVCTLDGGRERLNGANQGRSSVQPKTILPLLDQSTRKRLKQPRSMSLATGYDQTTNDVEGTLRHRNGVFQHPGEFQAQQFISAISRKRKYKPIASGLNKDDARVLHADDRRLKMLRTLAMMGNDVTGDGPRHARTRAVNQNPANAGSGARIAVDRVQSLHSGAVTESNYARFGGHRPSIMDDTPYTVSKTRTLSPIRSLTPRDRWKIAATAANTQQKKAKPPKPKFAQIATLNTGCVFGLEELMKRTELQLSLVSEGAECVLISKKLFMKHAGARTLRKVNRAIGRYPTEAYIRSQLAEQTDWSRFREEVVRDVLVRRDEKDLLSVVN